MYETRVIAIGRMKAGWHGAYLDGSSGSGGRLEDYLKNAVDGAVVYDGDAADYGDCVDLVMRGPMFKPLTYGVKRFGRQERHAAANMLPGMSGGFDTILSNALAEPELKAEEKYGSLDYVDWAIYRRLLSAVPGFRFGKVVAGVIVWE